MKIINHQIPKEMESKINEIKEFFKDDQKVGEMFEVGYKNTYQTTLKKQDDGTTFVITGDIPAMWNRDSVAQVLPLLEFCDRNEEIKNVIKGVIEIHKQQIIRDPYANAHNYEPAVGEHATGDIPQPDGLVWERKYEVDSLCYPIDLAYKYWKVTNDTSIFDAEFLKSSELIIETFILEQNHQNSNYSFQRIADWLLFGEPERIRFETLPNEGKGSRVGYTGMTWSGFRPSDDACQYGYLIPANMYAVVILRQLKEILEIHYKCPELETKCHLLAAQIDQGIKQFGIVETEKYGQIYAYEVNGLGDYLLMDDANVPSLLSAPYLGYLRSDDPIYLNTRKFLLSTDNPYFYASDRCRGIGSAHTPERYFWHIALAIEGLTTDDIEEKKRILKQFKETDAGTNMMHEGVSVDNPEHYTRPWFSWANSLFATFVLDYYQAVKKGEENEL